MNCRNCAAPLTEIPGKCEYCGTLWVEKSKKPALLVEKPAKVDTRPGGVTYVKSSRFKPKPTITYAQAETQLYAEHIAAELGLPPGSAKVTIEHMPHNFGKRIMVEAGGGIASAFLDDSDYVTSSRATAAATRHFHEHRTRVMRQLVEEVRCQIRRGASRYA